MDKIVRLFVDLYLNEDGESVGIRKIYLCRCFKFAIGIEDTRKI